MLSWLQDLRYALRSLRAHPSFALLAIGTLALAIGPNTALFSIVDATLMRPVATPAIEQLHVVRISMPQYNLLDAELAAAHVESLAGSGLFTAMGGHRPQDYSLTGFGDATRIRGATTTGDLFGVFAVRPHLGRLYDAQNARSAPGVAVVSYAFWQELTGGDPSILGRAVSLDGRPYEVVGVLPAEFRYPRDVQVFTPLPADAPERRRGAMNMTAIGRVPPGVTPEQLAVRLRMHGVEDTAETSAASPFFAVPLTEFLAGRLRRVLLVLMGAVGLVLLIACANVASLQLVRTAARRRELAVRGAMGASRVRLMRQLILESVLLALAGGAAGLWIGSGILDLAMRWQPIQHLGVTGTGLDSGVLAFTAAVALTAAVIFGAAPALRALGVVPGEMLHQRGTTGGAGQQRLLRGTATVQVALSLVLLVGAMLMLRSVRHLLSDEFGFADEGVTTFHISLPSARYPTGERREAFLNETFERIRMLPGVQTVGSTSSLPFGDAGPDSNPLDIPGRPPQPGEAERHANTVIAGGDYFETLGIPLLAGSVFAPEHTGEVPVVVINEALARSFFPDDDPVNRYITHIWGDTPLPIIGVVGDVSQDEPGQAQRPTVYYSYRHVPLAGQAIALRSTVPEAALMLAVRATLREMDPEIPLYDVATMRSRIESSVGTHRLALATLTAFAALSLLLTVLGVYGVLRYQVHQRTHEIGIRLAVGARPADVLGMVLRQGIAITVVGLAAGTALALGLTRLLGGLLHGVSSVDAGTFLSMIVLLGIIATAATLLPARRAARVDPLQSLRQD